jgi:hypothetical protein
MYGLLISLLQEIQTNISIVVNNLKENNTPQRDLQLRQYHLFLTRKWLETNHELVNYMLGVQAKGESHIKKIEGGSLKTTPTPNF